MKFRLFALAAVVAAATFASPAAAQDPRGTHVGGFIPSGGPPSVGSTGCSRRAFECGALFYSLNRDQEGLAWLQYGARHGSAPSMRSIGFILLRGEDGARADPAAAMGWFYEAALRNDAISMLALSRGFERGVGVERDPALARFWLERAARAGNYQARRALRGLQ
jgi:TPR repeat protein